VPKRYEDRTRVHNVRAKSLIEISEQFLKLLRVHCIHLFLQSIKVINDHSNKQVQGEERTDDYEHDEVEIRNKTMLAFWLIINLKKKEKTSYKYKIKAD